VPSGETQDRDRSPCRAVRSLQSGLSEIIAKYGHYSPISAGRERNFSAVQTAWRSERDSNPRYRSEWRKSRRVRKLQGINLLSGDLASGGVAELWQASAVSSPIERRMAYDSVAESGLCDACHAARIGSHVTACLPRSPTAKISPQDVLVRRRMVGDFRRFLSVGLLPATLSTGIGSDTQRPFAIVIIAGLISGSSSDSSSILSCTRWLPPRGRCAAGLGENPS
jgi:hypothetical protein